MPTKNTIERFQFRRTSSGGELFGRMMEIRPIAEDAFKAYIQPRLNDPRVTLDTFRENNPTLTHYALIKRHGEAEWVYASSGGLDTLRPHDTDATLVDSFSSPKAINFGFL